MGRYEERGRQRPVLVGGTGRSGSTIVGHLLDHHRDLTLCRPMEVRFITLKDGLADALAAGLSAPGSADAQRAAVAFVRRLEKRWFMRAETVGLHESMTREELDALTSAYLSDVAAEPLEASQTLTYAIMDRIAARLHADRLVDTTPANARRADLVEPIYPESSVVIVTRDGRDVAASFVKQTFGPDDPFAALTQWEDRMLQAHRATALSRPGRVLSIELVDLVVRERESTVAELCAFLGVDVDPAMVAWFDANVTSEGMHPGRWRQDFDSGTATRLDAQYADAGARLEALGVAIPD